MTGRAPFAGSFTQQLPIPEAGIEAAVAVLRSGRLHRYNAAPGEEPETVALEREYAAWQGAPYCLAVASGGQAMQIALRAAGVGPGDRVLTNAFTLAPVPGAIVAVGAVPVLVEITESLVIDPADLAAKAAASGARHLLLSNMRGHLADMEALGRVCAAQGLTLIEDCAHTMGATFRCVKSGNFGLAGCFSTQTYKHLNSGEGGFVTSSDPDFMARATMLSGSYMLYALHGAGPGPDHYVDARLDTPNMSARMDNLRAAILRAQLPGLDAACAAWNARHARVARALAQHPAVVLPQVTPGAQPVQSSIQFRLPGIAPAAARGVVDACAARGVVLKWFGAYEPLAYTSAHRSWRYIAAQDLPATDRVLSGLFDMRLPLTFSLEDCDTIAGHILDVLYEQGSP